MVEVFENFMTSEECGELIELARPRLTKSLVWDVATGTQKEDDYRKSEQMFFARGENELVRRIENAISSLTKWPVENGEGIQVLHYTPGGYYKVHADYFDEAFEGNKGVLARGGQRAATFMVYLNHVPEGGATFFPELDFRGIPHPGRALYWKNVTPEGVIDPKAMHAAEPVIKGHKYVMTKWIREREFQ